MTADDWYLVWRDCDRCIGLSLAFGVVLLLKILLSAPCKVPEYVRKVQSRTKACRAQWKGIETEQGRRD